MAAIISLLPLSGALAATAPAQPAATTGTNGQGLEISPPVIELSADPGKTVVANIRLRNVSSGELSVQGKADDFGAKGEDGTPQILLDEKEATRYSLKYWVQGVPNFDLASREVKTAQITINVPANAEPGGHYGVIRFTGLPKGLEDSGVSLSASLGALVLLRVSGNITEKLSLTEFYASHGSKRGHFFENGPITLTERIRNEGSVHVKPIGYVTVKDTFGKQIAHQPLADPARNILPDSIRKFDQTLKQKHLFGRYTATFNVTYGTKKDLTSTTLAFWVIPYKLILLLLLALLILFFGLRQSVRTYNRRVIEQAKRR